MRVIRHLEVEAVRFMGFRTTKSALRGRYHAIFTEMKGGHAVEIHCPAWLFCMDSDVPDRDYTTVGVMNASIGTDRMVNVMSTPVRAGQWIVHEPNLCNTKMPLAFYDPEEFMARYLRVDPVAWAWRKDTMRGWALGHLPPTSKNCHDEIPFIRGQLMFIGPLEMVEPEKLP